MDVDTQSLFVQALAQLSECGLAAPIETFLAGREQSKLATSWLTYKQTVLLGHDGLPKCNASDSTNVIAKLWTGISPSWLSSRRTDDLRPPAHVGIVERATLQLEQLSDIVLEAFLESRTVPDPPSQKLLDLAGPFSELIFLLLSVTSLCCFDGDARNHLSERALRLASVMVKSLCIAAQSARQTPEMPVLLIECFQLNEYFSRVGSIFVKASGMGDGHLAQASIGLFEDLGHSSDLTSWTTTLVKSLSQSLSARNVHHLLEPDAQSIPLWNLAMSLLSHSDGMIRTHIQSTVLHLLQIAPLSMLTIMRDGDSRLNARLDAALTSALRCATYSLDRTIVSIRMQRASLCACWQDHEPQSIWRPGHLCKHCQHLLLGCAAATGDLEDIFSFLEELLEQPVFAEEHHRVVMLSRIMQGVVLTFWIRSITPSLSTLLNYRRVIHSGLRSTSNVAASKKKKSKHPSSEKPSRQNTLCHLTVRVCLDVMQKRLSASHPSVVGLAWLTISAPAIPATLMALLIGKPFLKAMRDLSAEQGDKHFHVGGSECCCCVAGRMWPVAKWWCGGREESDLAKKILQQLALTVRKGVQELHGDKHECLGHLKHLVANAPRSCKVSRWSRRLSSPYKTSAMEQSFDLAFPFETASLLASIDVHPQSHSGNTKIFTPTLLKALKLTALSTETSPDLCDPLICDAQPQNDTSSSGEPLGDADNDEDSVQSSESFPIDPAAKGCDDRVIMRLPSPVSPGETLSSEAIEETLLEVYGKHLHCVAIQAHTKETGEVSITFNREDADDCEYYWEIWSSLFHFQNMSGLEMQLVSSIIRSVPLASHVVDTVRAKVYQILSLAWDSLQDSPLRSDGGVESINSIVRQSGSAADGIYPWSLPLYKGQCESTEVLTLKSSLIRLGFIGRIIGDLREHAAMANGTGNIEPTSMAVLFVLDDLACRQRRHVGHVVESDIRSLVTLMTCLDSILEDLTGTPSLVQRLKEGLGSGKEEGAEQIYVMTERAASEFEYLDGTMFPCKLITKHPKHETRDCYFLIAERFLAVGEVSDLAVAALSTSRRVHWDDMSIAVTSNRSLCVCDTNGRELFALSCPDAAVFRAALHHIFRRQAEYISFLWDNVALPKLLSL